MKYFTLNLESSEIYNDFKHKYLSIRETKNYRYDFSILIGFPFN